MSPCLFRFTLSIAATVLVTVAHASENNAAAIPDWLFPVDPAAGQTRPAFDDVEEISIPGSEVAYTLARINNPFNAPDWHPNDHESMPSIVANGRSPQVMACAYCHTPTGQGRPENSALAGLPATYIAEQLRNMRSGARVQVGRENYLPIRNMIRAALPMTDAEIEQAADYFAKQELGPRVTIQETARIPKVIRAGWVYTKDARGGEEDLGERIIEVAPDIVRHERRDDHMVYIAYVPPHSISRGRALALGRTPNACAGCHGSTLQGTELGPPLAGRSPTYLMRQLLAFKLRTRSTLEAKPMEHIADALSLSEMISAVAYAGSLDPSSR